MGSTRRISCWEITPARDYVPANAPASSMPTASSKTMPLLRASALCLLVTMASCSKKDPVPVHPAAGLSVFSNGSLSSTCGFYRTTEAGVTVRSQEMSVGENGHQLNVTWSVEPKTKSDLYRLEITADGAISKREVEFSGKPIVLLEQPFKVVLENTAP